MATDSAISSSLTDDRVDRFRRDGYLRFDALIRGEKLAHYTSVLDELVRRAESMAEESGHFALHYDDDNAPVPGMLHKVQGVCVAEPRMLDLAREPAVTDEVASLIGDGMDCFGTKFFPMLPRGGTSTDWHQDNYYFGTKTDGTLQGDDEIVTCGIYLEDTDRWNGCLRIVPGSHCHGAIVEHRSRPGVYGHGHWADVADADAVDVECPAGTVVLFSANLLHAAHRNHSDRTRYSTAWHYVRSDLTLDNFPKGGYDDLHPIRSAG